MSDSFQKVVEVFEELCDLDREEQARRLEQLACEDRGLSDEVASLLEEDRAPDDRVDRRVEDLVPWHVVLEEDAGGVREEVLESLGKRGRTLEHFERRDEVGHGGMGTVYRLWDTDLERILAIKVLGGKPSGRSSSGRRRLRRFLYEARVTSQLDHPGIAPVHDVGIDEEGRAYFTMKYVEGRTLKEVFELERNGDEHWTQARVLDVLMRVCEAMSYAHDKGIAHRDLKPSNIMVGRFGEVYVMDWGVARNLRGEDAVAGPGLGPHAPGTTLDGTVIGTPQYMSPEQARGDEVDERTDVYALGSMLYTLLGGRPPYGEASTASSPHEVLDRLLDGPPPPVGSLRAIPAELEAVCRKAMARAPGDRYPDMSALGRDLRAYLEGRVVSAHQTGAVVELRKWMQRNRALAASIAAGILVLAAGLVVSLVLAERAERSRLRAEAERVQATRAATLVALDGLATRNNDELWPAHPENLASYDFWLAQADELRQWDFSAVERDLAELRARALPRTDEGLARERQGGEYRELERLEAELAAARRARDVREGRAAFEEPALDRASLPPTALGANDWAWLRIDPDREVFGLEAEGLAAALVADAEARPHEAHLVADTLAWAWFANGHDEEALAESERAAALAPPNDAPAVEESRARLVEAVRRAATGEALEDLERRREQLRARAAQRRTWSFGSFEDHSQHQVLSLMSETWEWLFDPDTGMLEGISPEHGWGIERRKAWAEGVAERTTDGAAARARWDEAIASIADERECPLYGGLEIAPQVGLLPLRRNDASGLWEFAHLQTGEPARVGAGGELRIGPETGLVFVLLPGGEFSMGAQGERPDLPNFDPLARPSEGPVHTVELAPFFLSKYELTQAQWERFTGANPSYYGPDYDDGRAGIDGTHPVERVSWYDAERVCRWLGLGLPSEAQWEYAARGGTDSPWWSGSRRESMLDDVNLADRSAGAAGAPWPQIADWPELDDGFALHAPVDAFSPNPFGLHNVHGNVFEWCLDAYAADFYTHLHGPDPVALDRDGSGDNRVSRGGSYRSTAYSARAAFRQNDDPGSANGEVGLRPARPLSRR